MAQKPRVVKGGWVGAAFLVVLATVATVAGYYQMIVLPTINVERPGRNVILEITAIQWAFSVNGTLLDAAHPLELFVNDNVTFIIHSEFDRDPSFQLHGFLIQGLMDAALTLPKGEIVTFSLTFVKPGEFTLICTIFCGVGHGDMKATIVVSR